MTMTDEELCRLLRDISVQWPGLTSPERAAARLEALRAEREVLLDKIDGLDSDHKHEKARAEKAEAALAEAVAVLRRIKMSGIQYRESPVDCVARLIGEAKYALESDTLRPYAKGPDVLIKPVAGFKNPASYTGNNKHEIRQEKSADGRYVWWDIYGPPTDAQKQDGCAGVRIASCTSLETAERIVDALALVAAIANTALAPVEAKLVPNPPYIGPDAEAFNNARLRTGGDDA